MPPLHIFFPDEEAVSLPVSGGGNNSIFRIDAESGRFCIKQYPRDDGVRKRQETERSALVFLKECGIEEVPRYYASFQEYSLYSWVKGNAISTPIESDINQAVSLLMRLQACSAHEFASAMFPAYEACLSLNAFIAQLGMRYDSLAKAATHDLEFQEFLHGNLGTAVAKVSRRALRMYERRNWTNGPLEREAQRLIHGDYGLYNCLKEDCGRLWVIDFEYFGWDDPVKMVADFVLHPGRALSPELRALFLEATFQNWRYDLKSCERLGVLLPLFAVRWACIVLSGFLLKKEAKHSSLKRSMAKQEQMRKASSLLTLCEREGLL
jgi:thiamine kinase-like enzyme